MFPNSNSITTGEHDWQDRAMRQKPNAPNLLTELLAAIVGQYGGAGVRPLVRSPYTFGQPGAAPSVYNPMVAPQQQPQQPQNPMLGIPGMDRGQGGGFIGNAARAGGMQNPIQGTMKLQGLDREAQRYRDNARKLQEKAMQQMEAAARLEMPKRQRPINDTEAGIGGLIMLLAGALGGGQGAAEFAQGFLGSRQQNANQANEEAMRQYQMQTQQMGTLADIDAQRAKLDMGEAERVDRERQMVDNRMDKEAQRKNTALSGVLGRLSSDLDKAPYERIPVIIGQMNEIYRQMGMTEMVIPQGDIDSMVSQAKSNAETALKTKAQDARTRLFRAIVPYATSEAERNKLSKWVSGMSDAELDVSLGKSEAELYQEAKRQTEDEMRPGKVEGQDLKNQLKAFEVKYADQYYKNRNKKQEVDIAHVEEKTRLLPESIRLSAGRLRIAEILAENTLGNTAFDNELAAWKARTQPEVQGHIARVKKIEERMAEIRELMKTTSDEGKVEELTVELNSLSRDRANVVARMDELTEKVPNPATFRSRSASNDGYATDDKIFQAVVQQESGGNYKAIGEPVNGDRAYGKYQIMGNNIGPWSKAALGRSVSVKEFLNSPEIQDQIARYKFNEYLKAGGAEHAIKSWYAGPGWKKKDQDAPQSAGGKRFPSINEYYRSVMQKAGGKVDAPAPKDNPSRAPKNDTKTQPKVGGGKSRTVNVGGTPVKVYPKKG